MSKIGGNGPKIQQIQGSESIQQVNTTTTQAGSVGQSAPTSFEPNQSVLAEQPLPQANNTQAPAGSFKVGLMPRGSVNVGQFLNNAKQALDKLEQQINWRTGRMFNQLSDFFQPRPATQRPPIQAMYGVIMPGVIGGGGVDVKPPVAEPPPIQAMYGVIMPGVIGGGDVDVKPPVAEPPPIQAMYGVIMPGIGGGGDISTDPPIMQPMYGGSMPPGDWSPVIQPKYGVIRPPMIQMGGATNNAQMGGSVNSTQMGAGSVGNKQQG